jgi:hypothetical protein
MYDEVYECMVEAGVVEKLDHKVMMDRNGNVVDSKDQCYGRPTRYRVTKPEYILVVDETGSITNQKDDGLIGGQRIVTATNQTEGGCIGSKTDIHFTVLCLNAGNGEPVLCGIILKSEKAVSEIPNSWQMGIDITKDPLTGVSQSEKFRLNSGNNGAVQGGPVCNFQGEYLPCFVATSPKGKYNTRNISRYVRSNRFRRII